MYIIFFTVFTCILHYFYLVDDIYDTKLTFSYQYFIIYSVWYERPMRAYPRYLPGYLISDMKNSILYDLDIWFLEPWASPQIFFLLPVYEKKS